MSYFKFCPTLQDILYKGESVDKDGQKITVCGLSTINNLKVLREAILGNQIKHTLEVGLAFGGSALTILSSLHEINQEDDYSHTAIDPFQSTVWKGSALSAIQLANLNKNFFFIENYSFLSLPKLVEENKKYDLIYIDGSHLFENVFVDFYYSALLLNENGILIFDDCTNSHIKKVIQFIEKNFSKILYPVRLNACTEKSILKRIANKFGYRQLTSFQLKGAVPRTPNCWSSELVSF